MSNKHIDYRPRHGYVSEFDHFIGRFMQQHPDVEKDQRTGWYIWWDHRLDPDEADPLRQNEVPVKTYRDE